MGLINKLTDARHAYQKALPRQRLLATAMALTGAGRQCASPSPTPSHFQGGGPLGKVSAAAAGFNDRAAARHHQQMAEIQRNLGYGMLQDDYPKIQYNETEKLQGQHDRPTLPAKEITKKLARLNELEDMKADLAKQRPPKTLEEVNPGLAGEYSRLKPYMDGVFSKEVFTPFDEARLFAMKAVPGRTIVWDQIYDEWHGGITNITRNELDDQLGPYRPLPPWDPRYEKRVEEIAEKKAADLKMEEAAAAAKKLGHAPPPPPKIPLPGADTTG